MKKSDLAWMAGLFIGEGCVQAVISKSKSPKSRRQWGYVGLHICMADIRAIERFAKGVEEIIGKDYECGIQALKGRPQSRKVLYGIHLSGSSAKKVLDRLMPFMADTDKGDQYRAALERAEAATVKMCPQGHDLTHYRRNSNGFMECWTCKLDRARSRYERKKVEVQ
jgi:hypothetical protein